MDTLVFDIETKNFFTDPGVGWNNYEALQISVVGVWSYDRQEYFCFAEDEFEPLMDLFRTAKTIVGFSINRYDVPVLNIAFARKGGGEELNLFAKDRVDLLDDVEAVLGRRVSLEILAQANLGMGKTGKGAHAITLYEEGKIDELKSYCLQDVRLTKDLYDLVRSQGFLKVPNRETGIMEEVRITKHATQTPLL
jgi:DEAD/DEAH box helicase domain-containing protein